MGSPLELDGHDLYFDNPENNYIDLEEFIKLFSEVIILTSTCLISLEHESTHFQNVYGP